MATAVQGISEKDWLVLRDNKGLEYIDGKLVDKGMTTELHNSFATAIILYLYSKGFWALPENLVRIPDGNEFRPDVMVKVPGAPKEEYTTQPPAMVFEVLSKSNTWSEMQYKFKAYERWGVIVSLAVDPETQEWWRYRDGVFYPLTDLTLEINETRLDLGEIPKLIP